ncbi:MAG: hypothetical protein NT062_38485 [Proteobacteria bacterium]|nr:hypothetical protein [Pseudomonadota bacterium]
MKRTNAIFLAATILAWGLIDGAIAQAQPLPPEPAGPEPKPVEPTPTDKPPLPPTGDTGEPSPFPETTRPIEKPTDTYDPNRPKVKLPDHAIDMPMVLTTPTGWILPAAVLYSKTQLDTGGGVTSDNRVGLGDVAEFGVATTDAVRARPDTDTRAERIQPYVTASFRLGVSEDRLFQNQPGLALGFRKSFERNHDGFKTRIAELTLVASKHLGKRVAIHAGGAFWDASLQATTGDAMNRVEETLHGGPDGTLMSGDNLRKQIRPFGGIQVEPIDKSLILIDLGWAPEFCYGDIASACPKGRINLRPELSWGVRYQIADWMQLESGVRVADIQNANLLDAQIFGGITFTSWGLRHAVDSLK